MFPVIIHPAVRILIRRPAGVRTGPLTGTMRTDDLCSRHPFACEPCFAGKQRNQDLKREQNKENQETSRDDHEKNVEQPVCIFCVLKNFNRQHRSRKRDEIFEAVANQILFKRRRSAVLGNYPQAHEHFPWCSAACNPRKNDKIQESSDVKGKKACRKAFPVQNIEGFKTGQIAYQIHEGHQNKAVYEKRRASSDNRDLRTALIADLIELFPAREHPCEQRRQNPSDCRAGRIEQQIVELKQTVWPRIQAEQRGQLQHFKRETQQEAEENRLEPSAVEIVFQIDPEGDRHQNIVKGFVNINALEAFRPGRGICQNKICVFAYIVNKTEQPEVCHRSRHLTDFLNRRKRHHDKDITACQIQNKREEEEASDRRNAAELMIFIKQIRNGEDRGNDRKDIEGRFERTQIT